AFHNRIGGGSFMSERRHPMFLDLAVQQFALPETLVEIRQELRREQERKDRVALEIARAARQPEKNHDLIKQLLRQQEQINKRIEALEWQRSKQAFFDGLKSVEPTASHVDNSQTDKEPITGVVTIDGTQSTIPRKRGRPPSNDIKTRRETVTQF